MLNLSKEKLLIIIALILAGVSLAASLVLGLQVVKLKQDLIYQPFPTPTPKLGLSPIPSPKLSPTPVSEAKLPHEAKACQKDEDCSFVYAPHCLGECLPCKTIDISDPSMAAVNWEQCVELHAKYIEEKTQRLGHVLSCPNCARPPTNKNNLQAKCINGLCTKVGLSGEISPSLTPTSGQRCGTYFRNGRKETHCATCGNSICEPFENCTSSSCTPEACTNDCGPLYCRVDCE